jgi:fatty acid desaturase
MEQSNFSLPSISELKSKIPKSCFVRDEMKFLKSVGETTLVLLLWLSFYRILYVNYLSNINIYLKILNWFIYSIITGTIIISYWEFGHQCSHEAFSKVKWKNNLLGFVFHTSLLVPFLSWKHSHAVHHSKTGHIFQDESHVPTIIKKDSSYKNIDSDAFFIFNVLFRIFNLFIGWYAYLIFGITGGPARGWTSHIFVPNQLFIKKVLPNVLLSNIGIILMLWFIFQFPYKSGLFWYWGPYIINNCWLVLYTFLQHHDKKIKWYDDRKWNFTLGIFQAIDRPSYGWIGRHLHHHIGTNHVIHHLFPKIPHYNAEEATFYIRKNYPHLYKTDNTPIWKVLFMNTTDYVYQSEEEGIYEYV